MAVMNCATLTLAVRGSKLTVVQIDLRHRALDQMEAFLEPTQESTLDWWCVQGTSATAYDMSLTNLQHMSCPTIRAEVLPVTGSYRDTGINSYEKKETTSLVKARVFVAG